MNKKEKALLVGANINNQNEFKESMEELGNLAIACELDVVAVTVQNLKSINNAYCIGSGKVKELKDFMQDKEADVIVFNNELTPSQQRNLEKELERKVIDRTYLILEIFSKRAKTREAKLQVEVARLQYLLTRLIGSNESLGRQSGGVGTRNRGAGETKLELDRRKIEEKISELNKELELLCNERQTQRNKRDKADLPKIALVGYTNAGKSTLMNAMVEQYKKSESKKVLEKDMLFATLDTTVRNITLPDNKAFLLSDTVGFVSNLPHNLVKAFRSTLEEVREADLLLHVVDSSNENYEHQVHVTLQTLEQIGADSIPMVYVYNKADLTTMDIPFTKDEMVYISAKKRVGIDELTQVIRKSVFKHYIDCKMLIPYDQGQLVSYLNSNAQVRGVHYKNDGTLLDLECKHSDYQRLKHFVCMG